MGAQRRFIPPQRSTRGDSMANRRDLTALLVVGALTVIVSSVGLVLGFHSNRLTPRYATPLRVPDRGPILYEMRSMISEPDRVRFAWREVDGAEGYRVTVMTAADESLFTSPEVRTPYWTIPPPLRARLGPQTTYHWRLTVHFEDRAPAVSEGASFATQ